jgi:SEC-C motif-containing protein
MMRARYSAHVKVEMDFLFNSTHPDHRQGYDQEATKVWAEQSQWHGIDIVSTSLGGPQDERGEVEFIAHFRDKSGLRSHHERAQFERLDGGWLFTTGIMVKAKPLTVNKVGRNDACICGSGLKYKKCCGK